jgi:primase-polymerase (primpol)-like protein
VIEGGALASWAREFIEHIPERVLFMETSVSGTGVHVFVEAAEARGSRRGQVEKYSKSRFIRMTFQELRLRG